jgi:hypothetical protein
MFALYISNVSSNGKNSIPLSVVIGTFVLFISLLIINFLNGRVPKNDSVPIGLLPRSPISLNKWPDAIYNVSVAPVSP